MYVSKKLEVLKWHFQKTSKKKHAIEFDFAEKWAESIGQALHYSFMTGKRAKVVLILENPEKQMCYFQ